MSDSVVPIVPSICTFVTGYRKSHTTMVSGRHPRGIKVFTDYCDRMPGIVPLAYAHEGLVPGRIVRTTSIEKAPRNESEEIAMDILQNTSRIMSVTCIRTSDNTGIGLFITPSLAGVAEGGRSVLLSASISDNANNALYFSDFYTACPVLRNEHISDPGWYASTLSLIAERCMTYM
jgi:hypothetical protein